MAHPPEFDHCEHNVSYDDECAVCEAGIAEAKAAGALTPNEISIYWRGKASGAADRDEHQWNALEMARKADQAERRAEEAEFHVEQLRDARDWAERRIERVERLIDGWEHDGPDDAALHLLIRRVREALAGGAA